MDLPIAATGVVDNDRRQVDVATGGMLPARWATPVKPDGQSIDSRVHAGTDTRLPFKRGRLVRGNELLLHRRLIDRFVPGSRRSRRASVNHPRTSSSCREVRAMSTTAVSRTRVIEGGLRSKGTAPGLLTGLW